MSRLQGLNLRPQQTCMCQGTCANAHAPRHTKCGAAPGDQDGPLRGLTLANCDWAVGDAWYSAMSAAIWDSSSATSVARLALPSLCAHPSQACISGVQMATLTKAARGMRVVMVVVVVLVIRVAAEVLGMCACIRMQVWAVHVGAVHRRACSVRTKKGHRRACSAHTPSARVCPKAHRACTHSHTDMCMQHVITRKSALMHN